MLGHHFSRHPQVIQGNFQGGMPSFPIQFRAGGFTSRQRAPHVQAAVQRLIHPAHRQHAVLQQPVAGPRRKGNAFEVPATFQFMPSVMGRPLPPAVQRKMEVFFGTDFSDVRIHEGPQAQQIGALAFTMGNDLYFAPGQYMPHLSHGKRLLGHELAHVVQQREGRVHNPFGGGVAVVQDRYLEMEAEQMGIRAATFQWHQASDRSSINPYYGALHRSGTVQRMVVKVGGKGMTDYTNLLDRDDLQKGIKSTGLVEAGSQKLQHRFGGSLVDLESADFSSLGKKEELIFNSHGSQNRMGKTSGKAFYAFLKSRNFKGCKVIYLFACSVGKGMSNFAQELTDAIYEELGIVVPVYAPLAKLKITRDSKFLVEGYSKEFDGWNTFTPSPLNKGYGSSSTTTVEPPTKKKGGGCFLSTACIEAMGLPDNCFELELLRWFRDTYVLRLPHGDTEVTAYYTLAPNLVAAINRGPHRNYIFYTIYRDLIWPCVTLILNGRFDEAFALYKSYCRRLHRYYMIGVDKDHRLKQDAPMERG